MNQPNTLHTFLRAFLLIAVFTSAPAFASETFDDLVQKLPFGSYSDRAAVVLAIGATGDQRAVRVLEALSSKALWQVRETRDIGIAEKDGKSYVLTDAITGQNMGVFTKKQLKPIKANNRIRKTVAVVLGGFGLFHPDASKRRESANTVFKAADPAMLEPLSKALSAETDHSVQSAMTRTLAAIQLQSSAAVDRLQAVKTLSAFGAPDVRALLLTRSNVEQDAVVKAAIGDAADTIQRRLALWQTIGNLYQGLSMGSVLLLAAVGLAITFGVMGVINMAHGEMVMLGAYTTWGVQTLIIAVAPEWINWSIAFALPCAFMVSGLAGITIERSIIQWLYGRPLETLLATWGLSLMLQQLVRSLFGPTNKEVIAPDFMTGAIETTAGITLTFNRMWIILFSLLVLAGLLLLLKKTPFGLQVRAVTQNRRMASAMGVRTGRLDALTFGLGSGIAGIAGVALSQIDNVSPNLGQAYIIDSFMVVVFGGVGNLWGTLAGALSLGVLNKFMEPLIGAVLAKIIILVGIILFIQKRPKGLFAPKGRAVEN